MPSRVSKVRRRLASIPTEIATVRYLGIEVDYALTLSEQVEL